MDMDMHAVILRNPVLAILRNVPPEKTEDYAGAIAAGGVTFFEVALGNPNSLEQIRRLRKAFGEKCLVGAGTAISPERCREALEAGAQFLLTPGTPPDVLEYCAANRVPLLPGVLTPADVALCCEYGFRTMKLFPADAMPLSYVKSLKGPYPDTDYVAIGGVNAGNIRQFLDAGCIGVGLAGSLMPKEAAARGDWDACTAYVKKLTEEARG